MVIAKWRFDGMFKADAQKVAEEIFSIGETVTPRQILEKARDESAELHRCFEWDDSVAAEKYRISQAQDILRFLIIQRKDEKKNEGTPMRVFYNLEPSGGYKPTEIIFQNPDEYEKLLKRAMSEFEAFRAKYKALSEFREVFAEFDKIA